MAIRFVRIIYRLRSLCPVAMVFMASTLITLLFWAILPDTLQVNESSDYKSFYEPVARNILQGNGLTYRNGTPAVYWPPGYPLVLASIFGLANLLKISEQTVLSAFILFSSSLTSVFVFMLARSIWRPWPALVSSLVWMTYPFALWLTKQPNSETPFMVAFYGAFCLFSWAVLRRSHSWHIYFLVGLLIGIAMLIRPIAIGAGFIMGSMLWLVCREMTPRLRLFLITMILLGNVVAILPWQLWVYSTTDRFVLLSANGIPSISDGLTYAVRLKGFRQGVSVPYDVEALMRDFSDRYTELQSLGGVVSAIIESLQTQPITVVKLFALKAARSWYATDSHRYEMPILLIQLPYLILILWSGIITWKQGGISKQMAVGIWLMALYFWGMTIMSISTLRYMVPAIGLLFVLAPMPFLSGQAMKTRLSEK